ncbi:MAG: hypothetical protein HMLKMBBP_02296 [Planctomycetes bacterium]|nr:hypothetical protein [Planctomycetota bacterium]
MALVRPVELRDADGVGEVHVLAWRAAYPGLMPQAFLDGLRTEARAERWRGILSGPRDRRWAMFVAEGAGGRIDGFACCGPSRDAADDTRSIGELIAINVRPAAFGTGAGQALHDAAVGALRAAGFTGGMLKVVRGNARAIRFYERNGWRPAPSEHWIHVGGSAVAEQRFELWL